MIDYYSAAKLLDYDSASGNLTWSCDRGSKIKAGDMAGYEKLGHQGKSYIRVTVGRHAYYAHRIAFIKMGYPLPDQVDHQNGNGLDNSWKNLAPSNQKENCKNRRLPSNSKTGVSGVIKRCDNGLYRARISVNKKRVALGHFIDFFEACCARKSAERRYGFHVNHGSRRPL